MKTQLALSLLCISGLALGAQKAPDKDFLTEIEDLSIKYVKPVNPPMPESNCPINFTLKQGELVRELCIMAPIKKAMTQATVMKVLRDCSPDYVLCKPENTQQLAAAKTTTIELRGITARLRFDVNHAVFPCTMDQLQRAIKRDGLEEVNAMLAGILTKRISAKEVDLIPKMHGHMGVFVNKFPSDDAKNNK